MASWAPNKIFPGANPEQYLYNWDGIGISTQPVKA